MADTKTTDLTPFIPIGTDIGYGVDDPVGTPIPGKWTFDAARDYIQANLTAPVSSGPAISTANAGTAGTGTTATEYGDGYNHVTVLEMAGTLPAITGDTLQAVGLLVYTFPAGVTRVKSVHMDVSVTQSQGNINADTPDVGLGQTIATGAVSVLGGTPAFEDYVTGSAAADCTGTTTDLSEDTTPAALTLNIAGGPKTLHFNAADGWDAAAGGDAAATLSGTITIEWSFLGA